MSVDSVGGDDSTASQQREGRASVAESSLQHLADDMFDKLNLYLRGQLEGTVEEYALLEKMNAATSQRYADMQEVANNVAERLTTLNEKYAHLQPYLDQIDEIDNGTRRLEDAAYALDAYVKNLEGKFKQLEKRIAP